MKKKLFFVKVSFGILLIIILMGCFLFNKDDVSVPAEIDTRILTELLPESDIGSPTVIYRYPHALVSGDVVTIPYSYEENEEPGTTTFSISTDTYFYYVDYFINFFFEHPVEYIFIEASSGNVTRIDGVAWPLLNDEEVFYSKEQVGDSNNILKTFIIEPEYIDEDLDADDYYIEENGPDMDRFEKAVGSMPINKTAEGVGDFLIINGIPSDDPNRESSDKAVEQAKNALDTGGYATPTELDAKNGDTAKDVIDWLNNYNGAAGRNLTIYIIAHGARDNFYMGKKVTAIDGKVQKGDLKDALEGLKEKDIRVKIISQACYSGKFISNFKKFIAIGIGSNKNSSSPDDVDPIVVTAGGEEVIDTDKDPNGETDEGPEFSSGYFEGYILIHNRLNEDEDYRKWLEDLSKRTGIPKEELILYAAYWYAVYMDSSVRNGGYWKKTKNGKVWVRVKPGIYGNEFKGNAELNVDNVKVDGKPKKLPDWIEILLGWSPVPTEEQAGCIGLSDSYALYTNSIKDPGGHYNFIGDPFNGNSFTVGINQSGNVNGLSSITYSITVNGSSPFVSVNGPMDSGCSFTAKGLGTVAGYSNISVTMTGTLSETSFSGTYEMGTKGKLPGGNSIIYYYSDKK